MDRRADLFVAVVILVFSVLYFLAATSYGDTSREPLGEGSLPRALAVIMALGSGWVIFRRLSAWRREWDHWVPSEVEQDDDPNFPVSPIRPLLMVGVAVGYVVMLPAIGIVVSTPLAVMAGMRLWGVREWRILLSVAVGLTAAIYGLFAGFLEVRLPLWPAF
ncbi:MAG: hypothetical protein A3G24_17045 [Betaproteobacteria bacterium RIFCSPLOWO2_12_FULL_62_13]|nr:MAG: hypothetical protein A3G24_17045 [Betaproteobacteria bacterium RIFCSPLOWO2_12_FULL_62_13]